MGFLLVGRLMLQAKIVERRLAIAASDRFQVKLHVVFAGRIEGAEQVAPEHFAARAAQAVPAPDGGQRVNASVAPAHGRGEAGL